MKRRWSARIATGAALVGLFLTGGCQKTPKGQVVAIVNGREISKEQLAAELQDIPIPDYVDRQKLRETLVRGIIDRELQVEEAREQGLDKTPDFEQRKRRSDEELLIRMLGHRAAQTVPLPSETDIQAYIDSHPLQFARRQRLIFDQLSFVPPRDRRQLSAVLGNTHTMDEALAALRSIGIEPTPGQGAIDTGVTDPELAGLLDRAPAGEPIILPQGRRLAIGVISAREAIAMSRENSYVAAARAVRAAALLRESQAQIAAARSTAEIKYEPGWEPSTKR